MKKKTKIIIISIFAAAIVIIAAVLAFFMINKNDSHKTEKEEHLTTIVYSSDEFDIRQEEDETGKAQIVDSEELNKKKVDIKKPTGKEQLNVLADGFLKIESIAELNDKLCVIVENTSEDNIEYAVLTVSAGDRHLSFNITSLMAGERAILICNDDVKYDEDNYYVNWNIVQKVLFDEEPSMHSNRFDIKAEDGKITVKNKSIFKVKGPVYIVYKRYVDGMPIGSETRRVKIDGFKMREEKTVDVLGFKKSNCKILFVDYD